jgi:hypothetical protein
MKLSRNLSRRSPKESLRDKLTAAGSIKMVLRNAQYKIAGAKVRANKFMNKLKRIDARAVILQLKDYQCCSLFTRLWRGANLLGYRQINIIER